MTSPELLPLLTIYCHSLCLRSTELDAPTDVTEVDGDIEVKQEAAPPASVYSDILRLMMHASFKYDNFRLDFNQAISA